MKYVFSLLLLTWLDPCFGYKEIAKLDWLAPMPGPDQRKVGWEWHYLDSEGNNGLMRKTGDTASSASYWRSDGCTWTRKKTGFAPAISWSNCPSSGQSTSSFNGDPIWPLKLGSRFRYVGTGSSTLSKRQRKFNRKCRVKKRVKLKTVAGEFDTFKVVCKDRWITRTWWMSPLIGTAVAYKQRNLIGDGYSHEMTRIVRPADSAN